MENILVVFASSVAIAEVIIQATKDTVAKKMDTTLWASIVLVVCGVFGVIFDIYFNDPQINLVYVVEAILMVLGCYSVPQLTYDKVMELLVAISKVIKK